MPITTLINWDTIPYYIRILYRKFKIQKYLELFRVNLFFFWWCFFQGPGELYHMHVPILSSVLLGCRTERNFPSACFDNISVHFVIVQVESIRINVESNESTINIFFFHSNTVLYNFSHKYSNTCSEIRIVFCLIVLTEE